MRTVLPEAYWIESVLGQPDADKGISMRRDAGAVFFVLIIGGRSLPHLTLTEVWLVIFALAIMQAITLYPTGRARPPQGAPSDGYE